MIDIESGSNSNKSKWMWTVIGVTFFALFLVILIFAGLVFINISEIESRLVSPDTKGESKSQNLNQKATIAARGSGKTISLSKKSSSSSGSYIVNQWNFDDDAETGNYFEVIDNSMVRVKQDGVYTISAQMSFRMKLGMASFEIRKWDEESPDGKSLSRCISTFPNKIAQLKSCFTSKSIQLTRGDKIFVAAFRDDFSIDFTESRSSFEITMVKQLNQPQANF